MLSLPYFQVDAFAMGPFTGNPAGVCFLAEWLSDELLQQIAAENNLAETAFVVQRGDTYGLRWFTPSLEMDLCGHATLAPAYVLFDHLGFRGDTIRFETRSGELTVTREPDSDVLTLDFPARPAVTCEVPDELIEGLRGVRPIYTGQSRDYLAVLESEQQVRNVVPNFSSLMKLETIGIIITAPGTKSDFVSRFFAPRAGVAEDPVTGSAHSTLIPYWSTRLNKSKLHAYQISNRGGELFCENRGERVGIGGRAKTYLRGYIHI